MRAGQCDALAFEIQFVVRCDVNTHVSQPVNGL
jgi:hypothetical protein